MATDQLAIYNIALHAIGERILASTSEEGHARRLLDEVWDRGGGTLKAVLEQGYWNIAVRTVQIDKSSSVTPSFGLAFAFDVPTDFVRLVQISGSEHFYDPLNNYEIEVDLWYADIDPIFVRYISDDASYGTNLSNWPDTMTLYAGYYMATQIAPTLKNDIDMEKLEKRTNRMLIDARSKDAQQERTRFQPAGSWIRARAGRGGRGDRGRRNALIG